MTDLELAGGKQPQIVREVRLGPPSKSFQRAAGIVSGIPIGFGLVFPPHGLLVGIGIGVFFAYVVGWVAASVAAAKRYGTENNLAIRAMGRGEIAKAEEVFARWAPSRFTTISALARHNLGWTLVLQGRFEDAVKILEDAVESYARSLTRIGMLPTTRAVASLCHALLGSIEVAQTWLAKAELPVKAPPRPSHLGLVALVRAVIDCRKGQTAEAAVVLEHAWTEHEATMTGESLRMMRVIRAFALAHADGPRNQGLVERVLADMKPRYRGEFAFLSCSWPEMAAFLAAHGLEA